MKRWYTFLITYEFGVLGEGPQFWTYKAAHRYAELNNKRDGHALRRWVVVDGRVRK